MQIKSQVRDGETQVRVFWISCSRCSLTLGAFLSLEFCGTSQKPYNKLPFLLIWEDFCSTVLRVRYERPLPKASCFRRLSSIYIPLNGAKNLQSRWDMPMKSYALSSRPGTSTWDQGLLPKKFQTYCQDLCWLSWSSVPLLVPRGRMWAEFGAFHLCVISSLRCRIEPGARKKGGMISLACVQGLGLPYSCTDFLKIWEPGLPGAYKGMFINIEG